MVNIVFCNFSIWLTGDIVIVQEFNVFNQHSNIHDALISGMI